MSGLPTVEEHISCITTSIRILVIRQFGNPVNICTKVQFNAYSFSTFSRFLQRNHYGTASTLGTKDRCSSRSLKDSHILDVIIIYITNVWQNGTIYNIDWITTTGTKAGFTK